MIIMSLIVLKEMFEINCKCQEKCHYEEKRKSHTSPGMEMVQLTNQQEQPE